MRRFVLKLHPAPEYASVDEGRRLQKARAAALKKLRPLVKGLTEATTDAGGIETRVYEPKPPKAPKARQPKRWRVPKPITPAVLMVHHRAQMETATLRAVAQGNEQPSTPSDWDAWRASVHTWDHRPDEEAVQADRIAGLAAAGAIGTACGATAELTISTTKGEHHMNTIVIENGEKGLRLLYETAARLAAGGGGPAKFRSPDGGEPHSLLPRYGRADINVICEEYAYKPAAAMAIAGFVLFGRDWVTPLRELGLGTDLDAAFHTLADRFGGPIGLTFTDVPACEDQGAALRRVLEPPGRTRLVTIPKPAIAPPSPTAIDAVQRYALEYAPRLALPGKGV